MYIRCSPRRPSILVGTEIVNGHAQMEDEFNVVGSFDYDEPLGYPSNDDDGGTSALTALNENAGRRKRMREEMENAPPDSVFIHPIDWHMRVECALHENEAKRIRTIQDEIVIDRLSARIIEARKRNRGEVSAIEEGEQDHLEDVHYILERPPLDGCPWVGISSDDNDERMYIRTRRRRVNNQDRRKLHDQHRSMALVSTPIEKLVEEVRELREKRLLGHGQMVEEARANEEIWKGSGALWVDKYAPRNFSDLLSTDKTNRQVVRWLRLWDECVFRRQIPPEVPRGEDEKECELFALDEARPRRPVHRILLLSGAAGLGKTTLAGVAARLTGYDLVQLNASDSRNVADMERVIDGAVQSKRTVMGERRPNCLVLDEIDGAPVDTIKWLVKALSATDNKAIRRPIIAICNNLYTPALRELRAIALNVQMPPTKPTRIAERLLEICSREGASIERSAVETLVKRVQADVRLSLNILQYVASGALAQGRSVGVAEVEKAVERAKPPSCNLFHLWSSVLELTRHHDGKGMLLPLKQRLAAIERIAMEEDTERLLTGLHHNYTSIPNLTTNVLVAASSSFSSLDGFSYVIAATKNFSIARYTGPCILSLHVAIATHQKAQLQFPNAPQSFALRQRQSTETLDGVRANLRMAVGPSPLLLDVLPLAVTVLQPPIKSANTSLLSRQEQWVVGEVVRGLRSMGLTFVALSTEGVVQYTFSPPIDVLTMFALSSTPHRPMLNNAIRKMLAHEVLLSSVRQAPSATPTPAGRVHGQENLPSTRPTPTAGLGSFTPSSDSSIPLHYKYNNCFSNAVKRKVRITQLIS